MNKRLKGKVRDIEPNGKQRRWEICFDAKIYGDDFPATHESKIEVEWPDGAYRVMVGIKPNNPVYLRTAAQHLQTGREDRVSDLCAKYGLGRAGEIEFEVLVPKMRYRVVI